MHIKLLIALLLSASALKAQSFIPGSIIDNSYRGRLLHNIQVTDSTAKKKWFVSKYSGISTTFAFFKGGSATVIAAQIGVQLNRTLNNNLYAFAGISVAPAYVNFNQSFMAADFSKANQANPFLKESSLGIYSRAELGLGYINDDRTFSISGSIGIERSSYAMPFHHLNENRRNTVIFSNR